MTLFGWDASHYDGNLTTSILVKAKQEGISFFTHKIGEGLSNTDTTQGTALLAAKNAGIEFVGGYYIPHQGVDPVKEAQRCLDLTTLYEPWWTSFPGWFWQVDAERWSPTDRVTKAEVQAFADYLVKHSDAQVIVYASRGQYGNDLTGLTYPLWNAAYPSTRQAGFKALYPGDSSSNWNDYSGQTPVIWQYTSSATIAGLTTCDANAFRGTTDDFRNLIEGGSMALTADDLAQIRKQVALGIYDLTWCAANHVSVNGLAYDGVPGAIGKAVEGNLGMIASAPAVAAIAALSAPPAVDVDALATQIADKLIASNANGLTATDHAGIVADIKSVFAAAGQ